ncbi:MAG: hypothetical protein WCC68_09485 [Methanoregula sp.]
MLMFTCMPHRDLIDRAGSCQRTSTRRPFTFALRRTGLLSPLAGQGSGAMQIEIRNGFTLQPGTFNAVIAPGKVIVSAINTYTDLQRVLFLFSGGLFPHYG